MPQKRFATIIAFCKHCHGLIEIRDDMADEGHWEEPRVGHPIGLHKISAVMKAVVTNSSVPAYIIELDTKAEPHCELAKPAKKK